MAENSSNAPTPSTHIFIHNLPDQPPNAKVRFLCCVVNYDVESGRLMVEHDYPRDGSGSPMTMAVVDVNLVLENTKPQVLQRGAWINIIGYVRSTHSSKTRKSRSDGERVRESLPNVQAVLAWDAGAVKLDKYEKALEDHLAISKEETA